MIRRYAMAATTVHHAMSGAGGEPTVTPLESETGEWVRWSDVAPLLQAAAQAPTMREVGQIASETLTTVDNWLGHASTRQAATDALWRLTRAVQRAGYPPIVTDDLRWRGSIIRACDQAGIGLDAEGVAMRVRLETDRPWEHASGPVLTPDKVRRISKADF